LPDSCSLDLLVTLWLRTAIFFVLPPFSSINCRQGKGGRWIFTGKVVLDLITKEQVH